MIIATPTEIAEWFLAIADGDEDVIDPIRDIGLCQAIWERFGVRQIPPEFFTSWGHFSRNIFYPVPSPDDKSPKVVFWDTEDLYEGEYGDLRRDLARHLARVFFEIAKENE